jgi:hypothetical protein
MLQQLLPPVASWWTTPLPTEWTRYGLFSRSSYLILWVSDPNCIRCRLQSHTHLAEIFCIQDCPLVVPDNNPHSLSGPPPPPLPRALLLKAWQGMVAYASVWLVGYVVGLPVYIVAVLTKYYR